MRASVDGVDEEVNKVATASHIRDQALDVDLQRASNMSVNVAKRDAGEKERESPYKRNHNMIGRFSEPNSIMRHQPRPGVILGNMQNA